MSQNIIIDSYSEELLGSQRIDSTPIVNIGQSFKSRFLETITMNKVKFYARKVGSPLGTFDVLMFMHDGNGFGTTGKPSEFLVSSDNVSDVETLTTAFTLQEFSFTSGNAVDIEPNTPYFFIISSDLSDTDNYIEIAVDNESPTAQGRAVTGTSLISWTLQDFDVIFSVEGTVSNNAMQTMSMKNRMLGKTKRPQWKK